MPFAVQVVAEAYDVPIPGYATKTCGNLRLWDALPLEELDLEAFNRGDYEQVLVWEVVGGVQGLRLLREKGPRQGRGEKLYGTWVHSVCSLGADGLHALATCVPFPRCMFREG